MNKTTRTLNTTQLEVGMIVVVHGARLRLTTARITADNASKYALLHSTDVEGDASTRSFDTEVVDGEIGAIPANWLHANGSENAWTVKGNHRAVWTVEA